MDLTNAGRIAMLLPAIVTCLWCQPVAFEVASIKPQPFTGTGSIGVFVEGNTLRAEHATLNDLIGFAWNLEDFQLSGGPGWAAKADKLVDSELFQVIAKPAEAAVPFSQFRLMLQSLLADRFHLQVHHVSRQFPAYDLVVAKGGPKMKESAADAPPRMMISSNIRIVATAISVQRLSGGQLAHYAGRPVFDKTGLTGKYDFTLEWRQQNLSARPDSDAADGPSLFTALQQQLGLKLEPSSAPFDTVVIDHAEKPSEN
jgi:uncharacterized protein (TIGR03435 family)